MHSPTRPTAADPDVLAAIEAYPDDGERWLNLARWFADYGRDDEAAAVRVFWRTLREHMAGRSIEPVLAEVEQSARILGACAREIEGRRPG